MDLEELFLRNQVQRLNVVLAAYQQKYPNLVVEDQANETEQPLPWLTDRVLMTPLLNEYDAHINEMNKQLETYRLEHENLKAQIVTLHAENNRSHKTAISNVTNQLTDLGVTVDEPLVGDNDITTNLQERLSSALADNDDQRVMLTACQQEIERLTNELQYRQMTPSMEMFSKQSEELKIKHHLAVEQYEHERLNLIEERSAINKKLEAAEIQNTELKQLLEGMKTELINKDKERAVAVDHKEVQERHMDDKHHEWMQLEQRILELNEEISELREGRDQLEQQIIDINKKNANYEQCVYDAKLQVSNSVKTAENAILEKDQALIREKQFTEQVENLQAVIDQMVDSVGERTREEVDEVKKRCNKNISCLMEEIHSLEMENGEKQAQVDRALREKRAAESELEKLYKEGMLSGNKDNRAFDDVNRRACDAERLRDEMSMKLNSLQHELNREKMTYQQENSHQKAELDQHRQRLEDYKSQLAEVNAERLKLFEESDSLQRQLTAAKHREDSQQRQFAKDRLCLENDLSIKRQEYEIKVQSIDDSHRSSMTDLRRLLTSQQRMSAKWKEECNTITQKFESKISEIRSDVSRLKSRNDELSRLLAESRNKTLQVEETLSEYTHNIKRMEERVRDAEHKSASTSVQVAKQLSQARRSLLLNRQTDKNGQTSILKQTSKNNNFTSIADPLALSDLQTEDSNKVRFDNDVVT